jgi:hypothetical protein
MRLKAYFKMNKKQFYSSTAWKHFSKYVLTYYANKEGYVKCATCTSIKHVSDKELHLGHLIKVFDGNSSNFSVAFDERNVLPQCSKCNTFQGGRELEMLEAIKKKFGNDVYDQLKFKKRQFYKLDKVELKEISDHYREKLKKIKEIKGDFWK